MFKKYLFLAAIAAIAIPVYAGNGTFNGKSYTTMLTPTALADSSLTVTNSITNGVDIATLPSDGAMVFTYSCANSALAVLSFAFKTCTTTNYSGPYVTYTNDSGQAAWAFTNSAGFKVIRFRPNALPSRYVRVEVTPTSVTNGCAGAILVTE